MAKGGGGGRVVIEKPGVGRTVSLRTFLASYLNDLTTEYPTVRVAVQALVNAGCDPLKLTWLLTFLTSAFLGRAISREQVRDSVRNLKRAARAVDRLSSSQLQGLLAFDNLFELSRELKTLAERAAALAPAVHGRRPVNRDIARATLVHYVREATGSFHDEHVAALISMVKSAMSDSDDATQYTTDAHVHWRRRGSCQQQLRDGPSPPVLRLETTMNEDLRT